MHEFILSQEQKAQDKIYEVLEYLREYGFHLPTNYLRRMSGTKALWELRAKYTSRQYRVFLAKTGDKTIMLLHAIIKKTAKTPRQDIDTADARLQTYLKGGV